MSVLLGVFVALCLTRITYCSLIATIPQPTVVVAFEDAYDASLLASTLSDEANDVIFITLQSDTNELYENLFGVEVIPLRVNIDNENNAEKAAVAICEAFLKDATIERRIQELQPTFAIFPALRHDACLIPWAKFIGSIPVIWTRNPDEDLYVFEVTGSALPIQTAGFWARLSAAGTRRSVLSTARDDYGTNALRVAEQHIPDVTLTTATLYSDVRLILWGSDVILRSNFASLTQYIVEIGCHHCRGPLPLPRELQDSLVQYKFGTVVAFLDENYQTLLYDLAKRLPQGVEGQAVVWKNKKVQKLSDDKPTNLFIAPQVERQDLIGYGRTRVVLSHCAETELLETGFYGTPVICFPRNELESRNAARAVSLGFARSIEQLDDTGADGIAKVVEEVHRDPAYREYGRKVSVAVRDRIEPAVDRLMFWLRYMARTKDATFDPFTPTRPARTYNEDLEFFFGLFIGSMIGVAATVACIVARHLALMNNVQKSKGRYKR